MTMTTKTHDSVFGSRRAMAVGLALLMGSTCLGQSGTRVSPPATSAGSGARMQNSQPMGSGVRGATSTVALSGYCPVCVIDMKKWVKGDPRFSVVQDGKTYLFPGEMQKKKFLENPNKYTPALGGDCAVCKVEMHKVVPGSVQFSALHDGRLFLFPGDKQKQMFMKDPVKYANADLAANGNCVVCRVEMQKEVPGKPELAVFMNGMRYWFPSADQRKMFVANPTKYQVNE